MTRITLDGIAHSYMRNPRTPQDYALRPLHHTGPYPAGIGLESQVDTDSPISGSNAAM